MSDLSEAVAALCAPVVESFPQTDDDGKWLRAHTVTHPPLLQQLIDSIGSSTGSGGRTSGSDSWAMNVLDSAALFEFCKITSQISDWCRGRKVPVTRNPLVDLLAWHAAYTEDERAVFYVRMLTGWATVIEDNLNPKRRLEVTADCPICGSGQWVDAEGMSYKFPVVVEYRTRGDSVDDERALCRACAHLWTGQRELRQLRWDIDVREAG